MPETISIQNILAKYPDNIIALALHIGDISESSIDDPTRLVDIESEEYTTIIDALDNAESEEDKNYLSLDDEQADQRHEQYTKSYAEDIILSQIPDNLQIYFDMDRFIEDVIRDDDRGQALASYDWNENEQVYDWVTYFIYRI